MRKSSWLRDAIFFFTVACLLGAAPSRLSTADYFGGYAGTHLVDASVAARWLTWSETDIPTSLLLRSLGVKTILYTDPNRIMKGDPDYTSDETAYAHDCSGSRIQAAHRPGQFLMDPHSKSLLTVWRTQVSRYVKAGQFDAVFVDDANTIRYTTGKPCTFNPDDWLAATNAMQQSLGYPVIYNGVGNYPNQSVSSSIALNRTAIGGMMEECYGSSPSEPRLGGTRWLVAEATELQMVRERKFFFCLDNDTSGASTSLDSRLYVLASFLLSYDPSSSVLWEMFSGPSRFHVMPEVQLVPLRSEVQLESTSQLITDSGVFQRAYRDCYLKGKAQGPCIVAVNPGTSVRQLSLRGYDRTLQLSGAGVLDGGNVRIAALPPPGSLAPLTAVIAFR